MALRAGGKLARGGYSLRRQILLFDTLRHYGPSSPVSQRDVHFGFFLVLLSKSRDECRISLIAQANLAGGLQLTSLAALHRLERVA